MNATPGPNPWAISQARLRISPLIFVCPIGRSRQSMPRASPSSPNRAEINHSGRRGGAQASYCNVSTKTNNSHVFELSSIFPPTILHIMVRSLHCVCKATLVFCLDCKVCDLSNSVSCKTFCRGIQFVQFVKFVKCGFRTICAGGVQCMSNKSQIQCR